MIRKLALFALVILLTAPMANAACAGNCYYVGYVINLGDNVIIDDAGISYVYDAFGSTGMAVQQTQGITSKSLADAYCAAKVGAGSSEQWGAPYGLYSTNFSNNPPILTDSLGISGTTGGNWNYAPNLGNQSGVMMTIRCTPPTGGETILGVTPSTHFLLTSPFYGSNLSLYNPPDPIADFNGTPLNGTAPLTVQLLDNSSYGPFTSYSWSGTGPGTLYFTSQTSANTELYLPIAGNYTIIHGVTRGSLSDFDTKTDYIQVYNSSSTSTTHAVARDLYTGYAINGAQVDMYDVENASWTNTTTTNGEGTITTLLGHTLNIFGSATGYDDDNLMGVHEVNGGYYSLLLKPTNITTYNTTPGNLTLVVTVQDLQLPHPTITGAEVTAAWGSQYASGTTNAAGNTFFTVPNNTAIHLSAFKSGYVSGSKTHITGSANGGSTMETAVMYIGTDYVTPVPSVTATTGPGGTVPQTVDPYPCVGDGSAQDTANCQRKQSGMAADLISYGPDLMDFFIMLTFIGGLLLITGKRR